MYIQIALILGVVVPNNFPTNHQRPYVGLRVYITFRVSDTMVSGGGLALGPKGQDKNKPLSFSGWIMEAYRPDVEALGEGPWDGEVTQIFRKFDWAGGGGRCCKGYIRISTMPGMIS